MTTTSLQDGLPLVKVLTTGGTIAGVAATSVSSSYQSAARSGHELLGAVAGLDQIARLEIEDVFAKDSSDIEPGDWCKLYRAVVSAVQRPDVAAVVITHGTDTLEETAFFLDLLLRTEKPVVMVGAMRPSTSLSADGPLNLLNAIAVAADPQSAGRGVLVVMNDSIMTARDATKSHTTSVQAFASPNLGGIGAGIGRVFLGQVNYHSQVSSQGYGRRPVPFDNWSDPELVQAERLPRVDIMYLYAGMHVPIQDPDNGLEGLVLAGLGAGNVPSYLHHWLLSLRKQGVVVVRGTRVWSGAVVDDYQGLDRTLDLICSGQLGPHKARILLMLALRFTRKVEQIRNFFASC